VFGKGSLGAPFNVYDLEDNRSYTVSAGDKLTDSWPVKDFDNGIYHLRVHGPNGFYREFKGNQDDPKLEILCRYQRSVGSPENLCGNLELKIVQLDLDRSYTVNIQDNAYQDRPISEILKAGSHERTIVLNLEKS